MPIFPAFAAHPPLLGAPSPKGRRENLYSAIALHLLGRAVMQLLIVLAALGFLMWVAYRGQSVILFAPVAALVL